MGIYVYGFLLALVVTFSITPLVKKLALKIGAVDRPNHRKVHQTVMPRLGGLAIYIGFSLSYLLFFPNSMEATGIFLGGTIIILLGILDDRFELSPKIKLIGQIVAASVVVVLYDLRIELINLPFNGNLYLYWDWIIIPVTILWIVAITNAVNLIDGLDGLAAGVSGIATAAMMVMALIMGNFVVALYCVILLGGIIGFLYYNFYPAKIFMGDTGAMFLGFNLAALSILGFKNVTLFSFIMPIIILGVPLSDTIFAMLRRYLNKRPISGADKEHLHHCLLALGFSHRQTVMIIYGISVIFATAAIVFSQSTLWGALIIVVVLTLFLQYGAELIGLIGEQKRPLIDMARRIATYRERRMEK